MGPITVVNIFWAKYWCRLIFNALLILEGGYMREKNQQKEGSTIGKIKRKKEGKEERRRKSWWGISCGLIASLQWLGTTMSMWTSMAVTRDQATSSPRSVRIVVGSMDNLAREERKFVLPKFKWTEKLQKLIHWQTWNPSFL